MIDLHCHLLPGLDDGARDASSAASMASGLADLGFSAICCTPHLPWPGGLTRTAIAAARERLAEQLRRVEPRISLWPGAEHHVAELMERVDEQRIVTYARGDSLLVEFSLQGLPAQLEQCLFRLQVKGLVPVIAHVERYPEVQKNVAVLKQLREKGCKILINLTGLAGAWDRTAEKTARKVLEAGLADGATTDLHDPVDLKLVAEGLRRLERAVGEQGVRQMMLEGPARLAGVDLPEAGAEAGP